MNQEVEFSKNSRQTAGKLKMRFVIIMLLKTVNTRQSSVLENPDSQLEDCRHLLFIGRFFENPT